jgi:hypothetical protein
MIWKMKASSSPWSVLLFVLMAQIAVAQEMLVPLMGNGQLNEESLRMFEARKSASRADDTLSLPFFDDFSEPFTRLNTPGDYYPSSERWTDRTTYINNHMAINPISMGVATFDGLDETGRAYGFGFELPSPSDTLTSKPINLEGAADTVYLSFYYQPQGMGNAPESTDDLMLEFQSDTGRWDQVWAADGQILEDFDFTRVMIAVTDTEYLYNGFQFRFTNLASLAGGVDHWHLDYVYLNEGRTLGDTLLRDLSHMDQSSFLDAEIPLQSNTHSLLKEFASMPWTHFKTDPASFMGDTAYFMLRNVFNDIFVTTYVLSVKDLNGNEVFSRTPSQAQVFPYTVCGNELNTCNPGGANNFQFNTEDFVYPTAPELTSDSAFFEIDFNLSTNDDVLLNNTRVERQEFYNYYAYDDGTAELAYGLGNLENTSQVALKYDVKMGDYLRAIQLYLNPVGDNLSNYPIQLVVWSGNTEPETELWRSDPIQLPYYYQLNYFQHFALDTELFVNPGTIYIGWEQAPNDDIIFSVGLDRRTDARFNLYYNLSTNWTQSSIPGALMIRPCFGEAYDWVGVSTPRPEAAFSIYPNPSTGMLYLQGNVAGNAAIQVYDLSGRTVWNGTYSPSGIDLGHLQAGTYLLSVQTTDGGTGTQRIVLRP